MLNTGFRRICGVTQQFRNPLPIDLLSPRFGENVKMLEKKCLKSYCSGEEIQSFSALPSLSFYFMFHNKCVVFPPQCPTYIVYKPD